jgi:hypothetical protein
MPNGSSAPHPAPIDPAILRIVEALARWQARRDYETAMKERRT